MMMPATRHLLFLVLFPGLVHAQSFDMNRLLQQGVTEAVRALTSPPDQAPAPQSLPPRQSNAVPRTAPAKPASSRKTTSPPPATRAKGQPAPGPAATGQQASAKTPASPPQQASAGALTSASAASAPTLDGMVSFKAVTQSPLIRPIVLPFYKGSPILGYRDPNPSQDRLLYQTPVGTNEFSRWLTLALAARDPEQLQRRLQNPAEALRLARMFVAQDRWSTYFLCRPTTCEVPAGNPGRIRVEVQNWRGENEFELARSYQKFIQDYRDLLIAAAPAWPTDIYLTGIADIGPYSGSLSGMTLARVEHLFAERAYQDHHHKPYDGRVVRTIPLATYSAGTHINFPQAVSCTPEACEKILKSLDPKTRQAWFITKLRLTATDPSLGVGAKTPPINAKLTEPIVLHSSARFDAPFATLAEPKQLPAPGTSGQVPIVFAQQPAFFNADTLAVLVLKHHPRGLEQINLAQAAEIRRDMDEQMYDQAPGKQWPGHWGPFFPPQGLRAGEKGDITLPATTIKAFGEWSQRRAVQPLQDVLLAFSLNDGSAPAADGGVALIRSGFWYPYSGSGGALGLTQWSAQSSSKDIRSISDLLDASGAAKAGQTIFVRHQLGSADSTLANYIALSFPAPVSSYVVRPKVPPARGEVQRSEINATIQSVSFVPTPDGKSIMVIHLEPKQARLYRQNTLLAEATQDVLAASAQPATAGNDGSQGHDIVGLRLGTTLDAAEKIVRNTLKPDLVYTLQPRDTIAYQKARWFVSTTSRETIALYFAEDRSILGVERRVPMPEKTSIEAIRELVTQKYGAFLEEPEPNVWRWTSESPNLVCANPGFFAANLTLLEGTEPTREGDSDRWSWLRSEKVNAIGIGVIPRYIREQNLEVRTRCHPTLDVHAPRVLTAGLQHQLRFKLYDHGAALRAFNATVAPEPPPKPKIDLAL